MQQTQQWYRDLQGVSPTTHHGTHQDYSVTFIITLNVASGKIVHALYYFQQQNQAKGRIQSASTVGELLEAAFQNRAVLMESYFHDKRMQDFTEE